MAELFPPVLNAVTEIFDSILGSDDWKENLRPGSFRGVPFKLDSHDYKGGRRNVDHEFPSKEQGNSEDTGKKLPRFNLDLYVLGDDYFDQRDALRKALDTPGPGELVHPYLGNYTVQVGPYSLKEAAKEGRIARFTVEFTIAGVPKFPAEELDPVQTVLDSIKAAIAAANAAFETAFSIINTPSRVAQSAAAVVKSATGAVTRVARKVGKTADAINDVAFAMKDIESNVNGLMREPALLAQRFSDAFALLFDATDDFKDLAKRLSEETNSFTFEEVVGADTPTTLRQKQNRTAMLNLIQAQSISSAMSAAMQAEYTNSEEAKNLLYLLNRDLIGILESLLDDETFQQIKDGQVAMNRGLPPTNLGTLIRYTPPKTLPALVISNTLFGSIDKAEEIIKENKVSNPGFVPGGFEIEVTSE